MLIKLIPKTHSAHKIIQQYGDMYRVIIETPLKYNLESVNFTMSQKGLKVHNYRSVERYGNINFTIEETFEGK